MRLFLTLFLILPCFGVEDPFPSADTLPADVQASVEQATEAVYAAYETRHQAIADEITKATEAANEWYEEAFAAGDPEQAALAKITLGRLGDAAWSGLVALDQGALQWEALPGATVEASVRGQRTGIQMRPEDSVLLYPNTEDRWGFVDPHTGRSLGEYDYQGAQTPGPMSNLTLYAPHWAILDESRNATFIGNIYPGCEVVGPGELKIGTDVGTNNSLQGTIRIKVVPMRRYGDVTLPIGIDRSLERAMKRYARAYERHSGDVAETLAEHREEVAEVLEQTMRKLTQDQKLAEATQVKAYLEEVRGSVPTLTQRQVAGLRQVAGRLWDEVPGEPISVFGDDKLKPTGIELKQGKELVVIPHAGDEWRMHGTAPGINYAGYTNHLSSGVIDWPWMALTALVVDEDGHRIAAVATGKGPMRLRGGGAVSLFPFRGFRVVQKKPGDEGPGKVRVKIVAVED